MPKNEDMIASIEKLDPECDTKDMNNPQLVAKLKELNAAARAEIKKAATKQTKAVAAAKKEPATEEAPKAARTVAMGKSIITKRGILADGASITAEDLPEGALDKFVDSGHIDKN